jgi:hypothetical protein
MKDELQMLGRSEIDCGQFLNGLHTTNSTTDWQEFDRALDEYSVKACCLHSGVSFVETMIDAGLTEDPESGAAYFGKINTFVSYAWRSDSANAKEGMTFAGLASAVEDALAADPLAGDVS